MNRKPQIRDGGEDLRGLKIGAVTQPAILRLLHRRQPRHRLDKFPALEITMQGI